METKNDVISVVNRSPRWSIEIIPDGWMDMEIDTVDVCVTAYWEWRFIEVKIRSEATRTFTLPKNEALELLKELENRMNQTLIDIGRI